MDALDVALAVADALDRSSVEYFLGGSLASSIQGDPRATNDIDFVVDLDIMKVTTLTSVLSADFSVDQDSLRIAAVRRARSNLFYLPRELARKLLGYVDGGRTSERQWRDVVAILRVSGPSLDQKYLDDWSATLGLDDLLANARSEAG